MQNTALKISRDIPVFTILPNLLKIIVNLKFFPSKIGESPSAPMKQTEVQIGDPHSTTKRVRPAFSR